jgi:polysaccharide export outer membrane protein
VHFYRGHPAKIALLISFIIVPFLFFSTHTLAYENSQEGTDENRDEMPNEPIGNPLIGQTFEYTINIGDTLLISVWKEDDLREDVIVRPDGKISFPLAGDVPIMGLTFPQVKNELTRRLAVYLKAPVVSVSLKKMGGRKIIVLGEVNEPGVYSVTGQRTVLEAIALANGFTEDAVASSVIRIRGGLQAPEGARLDISRAVKETDTTQNIALQSEDIIYVPKKFIADVNYFLRQILEPMASGVWTGVGIKALGD